MIAIAPWSAVLSVVLGAVAGLLGALVGIGGGIVIVPALVLIAGVPIQVAVATSLVCVVASSTTTGAVYVERGLTNMRLAMTLEVATTLGGIAGGLVAVAAPAWALSGLFAAVTVVSAVLLVRRPRDGEVASAGSEPGAGSGAGLGGRYVDPRSGERTSYEVRRLPLGAAISLLAGALSGMLGVGGGFLKVPAMTLGMGVPIRVAAATSNFMIGVTAIASLFVYFARGLVHPMLAAPVALGVIAGAWIGTHVSARTSPAALRWLLAIVLVAVSVQMVIETLRPGGAP